MPRNNEIGTLSEDDHRKKQALDRSNAAKIIRKFYSRLKPYGFKGRSTNFSREREHLIQFIHIHKFSGGRFFRMHVCIRVLNESKHFVSLSGIDSDDDRHFRQSLEFQEDDESLERCANEMLRYVVEVAEPWFESQSYDVLLSESSPLYPDQRQALAASLKGDIDERNVAHSRSLF